MKPEALLKALFPDYEGDFYPTGSQVYGYPDVNSDYDFMVLDPDLRLREKIINKLKELGTDVVHSKYFDCIKFNLMGRAINLIYLNQTNYTAWERATCTMKAVKKFYDSQPLVKNPISDRSLRYKLFQELVTEFGGTVVAAVYEDRLGQYIGLGTLPVNPNLDTDEIPF